MGNLFRIGVVTIALGATLPAARAGHANSSLAAATGVAGTPAKNAWPPPVHAAATRASGKRYFIEFRGRAAASYGHMYVLYGEVNERDQIIRSAIAGLHPAGDTNNCINCSVVFWTAGHIVFVPSETGASNGDLEEKYVTSRYRVRLDEDQYKRVAAYIEKLQAENPLWSALWRNCVSFGKDIADYMGLRTPFFTWIEPKDFVDELRTLNGGHPQQPLADANTALPEPRAASAKAVSAPKKPLRKPPTLAPSARTAAITSEGRR